MGLLVGLKFTRTVQVAPTLTVEHPVCKIIEKAVAFVPVTAGVAGPAVSPMFLKLNILVLEVVTIP